VIFVERLRIGQVGAPEFFDLERSLWAYARIIEAAFMHEYALNAGGAKIWPRMLWGNNAVQGYHIMVYFKYFIHP
jgi:hypothetical protein